MICASATHPSGVKIQPATTFQPLRGGSNSCRVRQGGPCRATRSDDFTPHDSRASRVSGTRPKRGPRHACPVLGSLGSIAPALSAPTLGPGRTWAHSSVPTGGGGSGSGNHRDRYRKCLIDPEVEIRGELRLRLGRSLDGRKFTVASRKRLDACEQTHRPSTAVPCAVVSGSVPARLRSQAGRTKSGRHRAPTRASVPSAERRVSRARVRSACTLTEGGAASGTVRTAMPRAGPELDSRGVKFAERDARRGLHGTTHGSSELGMTAGTLVAGLGARSRNCSALGAAHVINPGDSGEQDHMVSDTRSAHFSRNFVGKPGREAECRSLSRCPSDASASMLLGARPGTSRALLKNARFNSTCGSRADAGCWTRNPARARSRNDTIRWSQRKVRARARKLGRTAEKNRGAAGKPAAPALTLGPAPTGARRVSLRGRG